MRFTAQQIWWLALISTALQGLTSLSWGTLQLNPHWMTFGASLISYWQAIILWIIGSQGVSAAPANYKLDSSIPPKVILAAFAVGASLFLAAPAFAQPKPTVPTTAALLQTIIDDANAALVDATSHNDTIAATCYQAIINAAAVQRDQKGTQGGKVLYTFQRTRDITRLNSSPVGTNLIVGCAALVQDARISMLQFFTNMGASVLIKGLLVP